MSVALVSHNNPFLILGYKKPLLDAISLFLIDIIININTHNIYIYISFSFLFCSRLSFIPYVPPCQNLMPTLPTMQLKP